MKKYNFKNTGKVAMSMFCMLSLLSCEKEDDLLPRDGKPIVTIEQKSITVSEGDPITLDFNLSYAIPDESHIRIEVASGTATDGDDFVIDLDTMEDAGGGFFGGNGYFYVIDPDVTSASLDIETIVDGLPEGTEELTLKFYGAGSGKAFIDQTVNIKIQD